MHRRGARGSVKPREAVAACSGFCVAASLSGACAALTSTAPLVLCATGLVLAACAMMRANGPAAIAMIAAGFLVGLLLPSTPPPVAGGVVTHGVGAAATGDLFDVLDRLDEDPSGVLGREVAVSGEWTPPEQGRAATVSRRIMSCCAADAIAVGFDVQPDRTPNAKPGDWVRVKGLMRERLRDGDRRFVLEHSSVSGLEDRSVHRLKSIISRPSGRTGRSRPGFG